MTEEGNFRFYVNERTADAIGMAMDLIRRKPRNAGMQRSGMQQ